MYNFLRLVYRCIGAFCSCTFYSYWQLTLVNPLKCGMFDQTLTNSQDNLKQQLQARRPQCTSLTCQPFSSHWTCCDGHGQFSCWATAASQRAVALWKWVPSFVCPLEDLFSVSQRWTPLGSLRFKARNNPGLTWIFSSLLQEWGGPATCLQGSVIMSSMCFSDTGH